jgi:hypothetical protein
MDGAVEDCPPIKDNQPDSQAGCYDALNAGAAEYHQA